MKVLVQEVIDISNQTIDLYASATNHSTGIINYIIIIILLILLIRYNCCI